MKNLSLFVILSLFFTPTIGLADKKFQIEETLFDLKSYLNIFKYIYSFWQNSRRKRGIAITFRKCKNHT